MRNIPNQEIAEAVGRRVLQWKGSEFLELIYLLEEKNIVTFLRNFVTLSEDAQYCLIEFILLLGNMENPELRIDRSGIHIEGE